MANAVPFHNIRGRSRSTATCSVTRSRLKGNHSLAATSYHRGLDRFIASKQKSSSSDRSAPQRAHVMSAYGQQSDVLWTSMLLGRKLIKRCNRLVRDCLKIFKKKWVQNRRDGKVKTSGKERPEHNDRKDVSFEFNGNGSGVFEIPDSLRNIQTRDTRTATDLGWKHGTELRLEML